MTIKKEIIVAFTGQPNCGKSTMFNVMTGATARVGNYPGITVDRTEGYCKYEDYKIKFIDLPGTYSLSSYSLEEVVARNVILEERPDVIVCMLDTMALERSLYLVIQLLEMNAPVIIGLNMMDEIKRDGIKIDSKKLSYTLGVPVVECIARKGIGKEELIKTIVDTYTEKIDESNNISLSISYGTDIDTAIDEMELIIKENLFMTEKYPSRWVAVKHVEEDQYIIKKGEDFDKKTSALLQEIAHKLKVHTEKSLKTYPETIVSDYRYGMINSILKDKIIIRPDIFRRTLSEALDKVITNRILGPIIMLIILYIMFWLTFTIGKYPQNWLQDLFSSFGAYCGGFISNELLNSLIVSGVINGVGAVLSFAPLILIMFAMLCFLEDLGYMARVAYMLDRIFKTFGLHGASVMPFIIAGGIPGGCAVPGVMSTRTLKSQKERLATIITAPFMVCGAKTTVYLMLVETFFPGKATIVMLILTIVSWCFALLVSLILRKTALKGESTPFIMELPPYRLPTLYGICSHTFDRVWQFVKKAGTVIFAVSIVMWCLMTFPQLPKDKYETYTHSKNSSLISVQKENSSNSYQLEKLKYSIAGRLGSFLENATKYAGFNWQFNIALIGGFAAKEVILSTLATSYSLGTFDPDGNDAGAASQLENRLRADTSLNLPALISLFLFMLLYAPCLTTVVAIAKESSWKIAISTTLGSLIMTYILSVLVYNIGIMFLYM